ncbi:MAG: DUF4149 domain-containing protein [Candidatus Methylomirabilales bacterium]
MKIAIKEIKIALIALWLGAIVTFSFILAPVAFQVLPSRHLAGEVVTGILNRLNLLGYILGPLLLLLVILGRHAGHRPFVVIQAILLTLMAVSSVLSREVITPRLLSLRAQMGQMIDQVPLHDPLRLTFQTWHEYGVALMAFNLVAALLLLALLTVGPRGS